MSTINNIRSQVLRGEKWKRPANIKPEKPSAEVVPTILGLVYSHSPEAAGISTIGTG